MSAVLKAQEPSARYMATVTSPLVRQFDLLATAPGGVARLRELILTLAVQGKLLPQNRSDEPVARQLLEIAAAKSSATALTKRGKNTDAAADVVGPFELPSAWSWVWLGDVTQITGGVTLGRKGSIAQPVTLPYLRVANVQRWRVLHDDLKTVTIGAAELPRFQLQTGDLLITEGGDWDKVGRTAIWRGSVPCCLHQNHVFKARGLSPSWNPAWAELYLNSPVARAYFAASAKQTTNLASINMTQLKACPFPLPPLAEQARVVARVEELMRLCDALEAKGRLEAEHHQQLLTTLLGTLTDSRTPEEMADNWQRVADHFDLLLDRPVAVDILEQTILQLAVRGLLVQQVPSDGTSLDLLRSIRSERSRLVTERRIKSDKPSSPTESCSQPFPIPDNWTWTPTGELVLSSEAGWSPTCNPAPRRPGKWGVLKVSAVTWGEFDGHANKELPDGLLPRTQYEVMSGDFLLSRANTADLVARSVVVKDVEPQLMLSDKIIRLNVSTQVEREFLSMSNNADHTRTHYAKYASGTSSSMKNVSRDVVLAAPVALPPRAEQVRIVARVNQLRQLCNDLRRQMTASEAIKAHLADVLVVDAAPV